MSVLGDFFSNPMQSALNAFDNFGDYIKTPNTTVGINPDILDFASNAAQGSFSGTISDALNSASSSSDDIPGYFEGLFSSLGSQAEMDRQYNSAEAEKNREFNAAEAEKNRQWMEMMSNTSYRRAMADLKEAGINPILAYAQLGGASTPNSATASGTAAQHATAGGDTFTSLLNSFAAIVNSAANMLDVFVPNISKIFRFKG